MSRTTRWGILGCGSIARKFADGLRAVEGAELAAVGSRTADKAAAFARETGAARAHGSYAALAADPGVDVIYVATPHVLHAENTLACLEAGKAVLCEKPFAVNAAEARAMVAAARQRGLFLMEAMWTRFLPAVAEARRLIAGGALGEVRLVMADFAFRCGWNPEGRLLNPALGGGGLLDVGVYTLSLASMILGTPEGIAAEAHIGDTGVDEQAGIVLRCAGGALAVLVCGVRTRTPHTARILGTEGALELPEFWHARRLVLARGNAAPEVVEPPFTGNGYNYQAAAVQDALAAGDTESGVMPLDESVTVMETMDRIRKQWGLAYPSEVRQ